LSKVCPEWDRSLRWRGKHKYPANCPPLVKALYDIINEELATLDELSQRSGVHAATISSWRFRRKPNLYAMMAVANVLGYEVVLAPQNARRKKPVLATAGNSAACGASGD
jgi:hypothetical protein